MSSVLLKVWHLQGVDEFTDASGPIYYTGESTVGIVCKGSSTVSKGTYNAAIEECKTLEKRIKTHFNQTDIDKSLAEMEARLMGELHEHNYPSPTYREHYWTGEKFIGLG